jgi:hypothetical protein
MAGYNEILVGRFNRGLQKLFGMKGPPPTPTLGSEIMPIHPLFSGAENRYLEGWNRFAVSISVAAVAASTDGVRIRNPLTSNVIAVIEHAEMIDGVNASVAVPLIWEKGTGPDLTTAGTPVTLDPRGGKANMIVSFGNNPGAMTVIAQNGSGANTLWEIARNIEWTLLPGDAYGFRTSTLNDQMLASLVWRERFLEDSERT